MRSIKYNKRVLNVKMSSELNKVYTITFGDVAENHAKMQKIGTLHERGYSVSKLVEIENKLKGYGLVTEMVDLNVGISESFDSAKVLVIRRGAQYILGEETTGLIEENDNLTMDKKALMKGKVVNKVARWNLCFADEDQEPNYGDGKGRIVSWSRIPKMARIRQVISEWTDDVLLNGEANYYYDLSQCGIGYHGDGERKKVFAVRMGDSMPLYFQWFQRSLPIGSPFELVLNDGDMYIMSEKAVGFDWLQKIKPTLRHSTGCQKFTGVNGVVVVKKSKEEIEEEKEQKKKEMEEEKEKKRQEIESKKEQKKVEEEQKKEQKRLEVEQKKKELEQKKEQKRLEVEQKKVEVEQKKVEVEQKKEQKRLEVEQKKEQKRLEVEQKKVEVEQKRLELEQKKEQKRLELEQKNKNKNKKTKISKQNNKIIIIIINKYVLRVV